jgi:hypothetical protein
MIRTLRGSLRYNPSAPRSGGEGDCVFRMSNLIKRGRGDGDAYWECSGGSANLGGTTSTSALTGTITFLSGADTLTGTGTAFTTELRAGQFFFCIDAANARSFYFVVKAVTSDTSVRVWRPAPISAVGTAGHRMPVIFPVDSQRGTLIKGNSVRFDKGTIFTVGDGVLRLDGSALAGSSLTATKAPKVSIYDSVTGNYSNSTLGLPTPSKPTLAHSTISVSAATNANPVVFTTGAAHGLTSGQRVLISGATGSWVPVNGTFTITKTGASTFTIPVDSTGFGALAGTVVVGGAKGQQSATYSIVVTAERQETIGYGNPSEAATVAYTAGEFTEIDFGAFDAPSGSNAWGVWASRYVDSLDSGKNYLNGPWFRVLCGSGPNGQVIAADLTSNKIKLDWLDAEIESNPIVTFDNDAPPAAEFVAVLNGVPVWISCQGPGGTSPGPFIFPAKPSNIEAAPASIAFPTSPPQTILGVFSALGRLYLLTTNDLQIAQGTPDERAPVIIRPFWKAGFANAFQLTFVNGVLYGNTVSGPSRSIGDGDEQEAEKTWAAPIVEFTRQWNPGHVLVAYDPLNDAVCYFHSAYARNSSGYYYTRVWMWGVQQQDWIGDLVIDSATSDVCVSGVATIGDHLEFVVAGTLAGTIPYAAAYGFETGIGPTSYYAAMNFTDDGEETRPKRIGPTVRATGRNGGGSVTIHGAGPSQVVPVSDLETGSNPLASVGFTSASDVKQGAAGKVNVKGQMVWTVRYSGTWGGGTGEKDRLEEVVVEYSIQGSRR